MLELAGRSLETTCKSDCVTNESLTRYGSHDWVLKIGSGEVSDSGNILPSVSASCSTSASHFEL